MERRVRARWGDVSAVAGMRALRCLSVRVGHAGETYNVHETYALTANFDNIGGLKVRAPVKSAGVVVGRVALIQFDNDKFSARVTLNVDQRYKFPKDTTAAILTSG